MVDPREIEYRRIEQATRAVRVNRDAWMREEPVPGGIGPTRWGAGLRTRSLRLGSLVRRTVWGARESGSSVAPVR
jgi:hypothetical protein